MPETPLRLKVEEFDGNARAFAQCGCYATRDQSSCLVNCIGAMLNGRRDSLLRQKRLYTNTPGKAIVKKPTNPTRTSVPSRRKIDLAKVKASLFTLCTDCGYRIEPAEERRIDGERMRCPKCLKAFIPGAMPKGY